MQFLLHLLGGLQLPLELLALQLRALAVLLQDDEFRVQLQALLGRALQPHVLLLVDALQLLECPEEALVVGLEVAPLRALLLQLKVQPLDGVLALEQQHVAGARAAPLLLLLVEPAPPGKVRGSRGRGGQAPPVVAAWWLVRVRHGLIVVLGGLFRVLVVAAFILGVKGGLIVDALPAEHILVPVLGPPLSIATSTSVRVFINASLPIVSILLLLIFGGHVL